MADNTASGAIRSVVTGATTDLTFSPDGTNFYVARGGSVIAYDTATGVQTGSWAIGTTLGAIDVSVDGKYLVAVERAAGPTTGTSYNSTTDYYVYRLSLTDGSVQKFTNHAASGDSYFFDISTLPDGRALLTQHYNGSGWEPLTTLDFTSGTFTRGTSSYYMDGVLNASADRSHISFAPQGISDAPVFVYTTGVGVTAQHQGYADNVQGYNRGVQAISSDGNLVAQGIGLNIYNGTNLTLITSLATRYPELNGASGLVFSPTGDKLYILDPTSKSVFVLSTQTWDVLGGFSVDAPVSAAGGSFGNTLQITADGHYLSVVGTGTVQLLDTTKLVSTQGSSGNDVLTGTDGADYIYGFAGDDTIDGRLGADILNGGAGNDIFRFGAVQVSSPAPTAIGTIDGGTGYDVLDLSNISPTTVGSINGSLGFYIGSQRYTVSNVEEIRLGNSSNSVSLPTGYTGSLVTVRSGSGTDTLSGSGNYALLGGAGDDSFFISGTFGTQTNGSVDGGDGIDTLKTNIQFTVDLRAQIATAFNANYSITGIENVEANTNGYVTTVYGDDKANLLSVSSNLDNGSGSVVFDGRGGDDTLTGSAGSDRLTGGAGNDIIDGRLGADLMWGGTGSDTFYVDNAGDQVIELPGEGFDTVFSSVDYSLSANVEALTLIGVANLSGTGGAGNDVLTGNAGNNTLDGGGGNDRISGGDGDDTIRASGGNDVIDGGAGNDTLALSRSPGSYSVLERGGKTFVLSVDGAMQVSGIETVTAAGASPYAWADFVAGATKFDALRYVAGYSDLITAIGTNAEAAADHFASAGFAEGRDAFKFNPLNYIAGQSDLIAAFGTDAAAATKHYIQTGYAEGRSATQFDGLLYTASYSDLIQAFGTDSDAAAKHYITTGVHEGRTITFDAYGYLASNIELYASLHGDVHAAAFNYVSAGYYSGLRSDTFDALRYIASNPDVLAALGTDTAAATRQFVLYGHDEGRSTTAFDPLQYAAVNTDVARTFGTDAKALEEHYINYGAGEGRATGGFDAVGYLLANSDLRAAGFTATQALSHWVSTGINEGRAGDAPFGHEQASHAMSIGTTVTGAIDTASDHDWFGLKTNYSSHVQLDLRSSAFAGGALNIFDDHGAAVAFSMTATDGHAHVTFDSLANHNYYLEVVGTGASIGNYTITSEYFV